MIRCDDQEICFLSYVKPDKKIAFTDWYKRIDPIMWIDAQFERIYQ